MRATTSTIEGPFYRPDAPMLAPPYSLVRRKGERGAVLVFSGDVRSTEGEPLAGAVLDIWQASAGGTYAPGRPTEGPVSELFDKGQPPFNLRGRVAAGPDGSFEVRTVMPGPYRDPGFGSEDSVRPAHLHIRLTHPGFEQLTTQLFFKGDAYLGSDPAGVVHPELIMQLERRADPADLATRGLDRPYFACRFGFVLAAVG
jgi:catechol 1,2-dioxygenase